MELILLSILLLSLGAAFRWIPVHRWRFLLEGRQIEVSNYAFHEIIQVDGQPVAHTRVGGNHLTWSVHAIALPDGRELKINISTRDGMFMRCTAALGSQVVFDSNVALEDLGPVAPTRATLSAPRSPPVVPTAAALPEPTDARWGAAAVLLAGLQEDPELGEAAAALGGELRRALARLASAQAAADAHAALGGDADEVAPLVVQREQDVQDLLKLLRELHLATSRRERMATTLPQVEDVVARLQATHEVHEVSQQRRGAAATAATAGAGASPMRGG